MRPRSQSGTSSQGRPSSGTSTRRQVSKSRCADIPLGHTVALTDTKSGADVIEYGVRTAIATADIVKGDYVHTHNVRSAWWQNSVA